MAKLAGDTRLVCISEPRIGAALDEGRIKQITGGQPISARELHGAPFEYRPHFALIVECNRKPRISGDDDGIWRRIIVIQFPHQFKGAADKTIGRRLLEEGPGVLRWLVEGTLIWLREGLQPPPSVQEAIEDYRRSSNPFGEWFADRVDTRDPVHREKAADLYASYKAFCEENAVSDREVMTSTGFGRAMGDKQLRKMKGSDGKVLRVGCRLRADHELARAAQAAAAEPLPAAAPAIDPGDDDDLPPGW
jgi:putative DNA primase/helicase